MLERLPTGVRLTTLGEHIAEQARHLLREFELAESETRSLVTGHTGNLRVSALMVTDRGRSIDDVCQSLSIGQTALRRWIKLHDNDSDTTNTNVGSMTVAAGNLRIKELEKQVKTASER